MFGFRKRRFGRNGITGIKRIHFVSIKKNHVVFGMYLNFSKAFGNIQHSTLFEKLHCYGIRGHALDLLKSYLKYRKQVVEIDQNCSKLKPVTKGVPRGSISGPLLFIAFINNLIRVYPDAMYVIYVDDASKFTSAASREMLQETMNQILAQLNVWSCSNNLGINTSKTKSVLFRPNSKPANDNLHIVYGDTEIELVNHIRNCRSYIFK